MTLTRRRRVTLVVLLVAVLLAVPGISYARALTAPGSATLGMRTVDWIRAHGGNPVINAIENWYYTRHQPSTGAPDPASLPQVTVTKKAPDSAPPPRLPTLPGVPALPGESVWTPGRTDANGRPLIYTSYLRPDPQHQSVVAGVAWMRAGGSTAHLVAGTVQPGGPAWAGNAAVPWQDVPQLVATFNSGFKMADIHGGFYLNGQYARPLLDNQASVVIDKQGRITVGAWNRDVALSADTVAVRQNLEMIVESGRPVAGLSRNPSGRWGSPKNQLQYTWRSGLGVDAHGNLIYVAGHHMNLQMLAAALTAAGAQRGMQLDIHDGMASFASWNSGTPAKLLPSMSRSAWRYTYPDQRDFIYLTAR
ncbi:hypothetical protein [Paractinoplanes lichenicola]|uniref:Phosphodiester glycosidase domain-containing protein n=1 Tax=Paractinoplanes lichenicola TaxID=2802976 RepID=A0ABS1W0G9_9ACTN|nr:hypothetical protein [Actinoplanes lichenicola]MBL7260231.1 hypothetical protein [Actinoplanes lichenicola]